MRGFVKTFEVKSSMKQFPRHDEKGRAQPMTILACDVGGTRIKLGLVRGARLLGRHGGVEVDDGQKVRLGLCFSTHAIADVQLIAALQ
jgi:hypothetical protein